MAARVTLEITTVEDVVPMAVPFGPTQVQVAVPGDVVVAERFKVPASQTGELLINIGVHLVHFLIFQVFLYIFCFNSGRLSFTFIEVVYCLYDISLNQINCLDSYYNII